ncbi:undecaprenyldiphospho-muramoylpentapeptide beta-N-acetylglucosaminyltransferase [Accumulibacter sp.]|uniref:undecaprenyldiphospho-muramoylpentapeptide beta-N-acetylglucosaminyltransferase n=1 Tax=Accumulibacter sp. TaxID=2053492 RepID=UPI002C79EA24|nr:undecaprenyldiphospho-muramoylpentapeptide beta-N-acetylglucosaminyltransferase [Accumulibacter sp.]HNB67202.1 undecaprenyldiphospho-muramoylpentapeptide beta-N-acetylglucosaminyltransferase [Accumulibacter sp.]HNG85450.1 undecaprenyldiphospho-muramoylpentapeptide beta-N-acetylglucosaminyltransferase [Accumulibacter sp.]HNH91836.1 undecaprenyldiphospho-muramoylpentapeptide beta-N-acetylglucosaminyltransferase [Accumulibacter sp.]HNN82988.1 undecaprenyldiphospho-muramoylpentapeptide beta-N-ac
MNRTLLVMAGGTGGHVFPGLAVADLLRSRSWKVVWMGAPGSMEAKLVPARGYEMAWVRFTALRGKGLLRKLLLPFRLIAACWQAARAIRRVRPDIVLGMGGYVSFPGGLMAALLGYPLLIHEQNSIAGLANRVLARVARRVACGFPGALPNSTWVGNPLRPEMTGLPAPSARLAEHLPPLRLLVLGGSQGATALNEMVPKGLALLPVEERPLVVHQAGEKHLAQLEENYSTAGVRAHCAAFIDDMAGAYAWADLVICRAGALTVAELAATGVASVLVPYPYAVDDHQTTNAEFLVQAGGALLVPQERLTPEAVSQCCRYSRSQLTEMALRARAVAKPDATEELAALCEDLAK